MANADKMQRKDYYKILGLDKDSSQEEIKKAYRRMAHKHHPDKLKGESSAEDFIDAMEAYHVLIDPRKREEYDRQQNEKVSACSNESMFDVEPGRTENYEPGFGFRTAPDPFLEFFENFFGKTSGRANRSNENRGYDHKHYDDLLG